MKTGITPNYNAFTGAEMDIDYNAARFWLEALLLLGNIGMYLYVWIDRGQRVGRARIESLEVAAKDMHAHHENRLIRLEADLRHAITKEELINALKPLYDLVRKTESQVSGIERLLERQGDEQRDMKNMILQRGIDR
jgi:hypothetical protein